MKKFLMLLGVIVYSTCSSGSTVDNISGNLTCTTKVTQNTVYLNNPSISDVSSIGKYKLVDSNQPFFSTVVLFAANIHGTDPNHPTLYYNSYFDKLLNSVEGINAIRTLQAEGIKVQLAYLGDHQNAGWSCNMNSDVAISLANQMVSDAIVKYGLDGLSIDDEYSTCKGNTQAFYNVVSAIKKNTKFSNKILSMAAYAPDKIFFQSSTTNVANFLDQVYEMTYAADVNYLTFYKEAGVPSQNLFLGLWPSKNSQSMASRATQDILNRNYGGIMIWAANTEFSSTNNATSYYSVIAQDEYKTDVFYSSISNTSLENMGF